MKKFISLLIGCSLVLAGAALAQPPAEQPSPTTEQPAPEKTHEAKGKRGKNAAKPEATAAGQTGAANEPGAATEPAGKKGRKGRATEKSATAPGTEAGVSGQATGDTSTEVGTGKHGRKGRATEKSATSAGAGTDVSVQPSASASEMPGGKHQAGQRGKGKNARGANANATPSATPATAASASAAPVTAASATATPMASASASVAASTSTSVAATGGAAIKVDKQKVQQVKQKVQQIKQQHVNFRAQARPDRVPTVIFTQGYRIQGSDRWQGPQYEVYRSYHPERHDRGWYSSHFSRVELIGGGYYYWNSGYWYPAWGYDTSNEYYAYDAPIYVGHHAEPPDRVIADVQATLQEMGYYRGEVDGLLGPLTREALTAYQADQGLTATAVIDQPTLDSLGMG